MAFESHLLPAPPGQGGKPFDIYFPELGLAVEVDGAYHFVGSMHGMPAEAQYAWDRRVDDACMRQGQRLVRLHYRDEQEWAGAVLAALSSKDTVTYTSSYRL